MRFSVTACGFANALALAALLGDDRRVKENQALESVHLAFDGASVKISANVLDHAVELTVPAVVEERGELAVPGARLSALAAGFPPKAEITVQGDGPVARVSCGRSHFRLPTIPINDFPAVPSIIEMTGGITLAREKALALLARPMFAIETEKTRYYLGGICLHDSYDGLCAVATDGRRLARVTLAGVSGLSS